MIDTGNQTRKLQHKNFAHTENARKVKVFTQIINQCKQRDTRLCLQNTFEMIDDVIIKAHVMNRTRLRRMWRDYFFFLLVSYKK